MSRRRWAALAAVSLVVLVLVATAAAGWHFSSAVLVPDHSPWEPETSVEALAPGRVVLERSEETERPGVYGLQWQGGRAIAGAIVAEGEDTVTRRLRAVDGYLAPGMKVAIDPDVFAGDPTAAFGLPSRRVQIPGDELGPMPAWLVPAAGGEVWAIVVHGINSTPETGLRIVPTLHRSGLPTLLIDYREDLGAPPSPDGLHHMGQTEWNDLAAAVDYALDHDATRVVLIGYSMGGAIVTQFMEHSRRIHRVAGIVLDAPVLDWKQALSYNASQMGFPGFAALPVEWAIGARIDADWDSLDAVQHLEYFEPFPILLFHGGEDDVVPISGSEDFADALPKQVTFFRVPAAGHTESWNVNPALYDARLRKFVSGLEGVY
jgi:pimeloyl-ACP methyl ester carboxylesterase